ncbi:MAG: hypothetical protein BGP16_15080 [Sphingobium sp. 66-54]|nr:MAG: hypothetical protein BGP16_15080 [Sphingobium sp. 66-54]
MSTLVTRIGDLATRVATESKAHKTLINGNAADLSALTTTTKTNLVAALNELKGGLSDLEGQLAASTSINDEASPTSSTETYSVSKIIDVVNTAIAAVTNGAPEALDTLDELAAALGDDGNFAATVTTSLANRVRTDTAAQGLTTQQQTNARTNIGAVGTAEIGTPDTNFVDTFNAGLV